jgi:hypothetical protein
MNDDSRLVVENVLKVLARAFKPDFDFKKNLVAKSKTKVKK